MYIGDFKRTSDGYAGEVRCFGLREQIVLIPAKPSESENACDYYIRLDDAKGFGAGFAWNEVGEKAGDYVSLKITSPLFPGGFIRARLFRNDDGETLTLSLNKPQPKDED